MTIEDEIKDLANWPAEALKKKLEGRVEEMLQREFNL